MAAKVPLSQQMEKFKSLLETERFSTTSPLFKEVIDWVRHFPGDLNVEDRDYLKGLICTSFSITEDQLKEAVTSENGNKVKNTQSAELLEQELYKLIPRGGYLDKYCRYTSHSEAPLAFHLFCAIVGVGALVNRRVSFDMGYYRVFPNLSVILIGPSGIKKTSAANIIVGLLQELKLVKLYSEKLTPEQLVEAMTSGAQGLIYAPEMAVFLGKQRYNEGLVPLITRFLDCPDHWASETIMRGKRELVDIALSSLMCTTPDWFVSNTPEDTFGGGFVARNLLIVQEDSPRCEPIPNPGSALVRSELVTELSRIHQLEGRAVLSNRCAERYKQWYVEAKEKYKEPEHELMATYYQRKPDHVKRLAIVVHLSQHMNLEICEECFNRALAILNWVETFLPGMLKRMFRTESGGEADLVYKTIAAQGGVIEHSLLVRKLQYRMNAHALRHILTSLIEAKQIQERVDNLAHIYFIKETLDGE